MADRYREVGNDDIIEVRGRKFIRTGQEGSGELYVPAFFIRKNLTETFHDSPHIGMSHDRPCGSELTGPYFSQPELMKDEIGVSRSSRYELEKRMFPEGEIPNFEKVEARSISASSFDRPAFEVNWDILRGVREDVRRWATQMNVLAKSRFQGYNYVEFTQPDFAVQVAYSEGDNPSIHAWVMGKDESDPSKVLYDMGMLNMREAFHPMDKYESVSDIVSKGLGHSLDFTQVKFDDEGAPIIGENIII